MTDTILKISDHYDAVKTKNGITYYTGMIVGGVDFNHDLKLLDIGLRECSIVWLGYDNDRVQKRNTEQVIDWLSSKTYLVEDTPTCGEYIRPKAGANYIVQGRLVKVGRVLNGIKILFFVGTEGNSYSGEATISVDRWRTLCTRGKVKRVYDET